MASASDGRHDGTAWPGGRPAARDGLVDDVPVIATLLDR